MKQKYFKISTLEDQSDELLESETISIILGKDFKVESLEKDPNKKKKFKKEINIESSAEFIRLKELLHLSQEDPFAALNVEYLLEYSELLRKVFDLKPNKPTFKIF